MELVNHPQHYNTEGRKECIVEMAELFGKPAVFDFCVLSAYKYLYRAGSKDDNPEEQDVSKARWYCEYAKRIMPENRAVEIIERMLDSSESQ